MPRESSRSVEVTVRIEKSAMDTLEDILGQLHAAGLRDAQAHARFGVVNGFVEESQVADLERVAGVAGVRKSATYRAG